MNIAIKHMVCPRCVDTVLRIAKDIGVSPASATLGALALSAAPTKEQLAALRRALEDNGFALVEDEKARLVNRIKTLIIERIHFQRGDRSLKLSTYLSQTLNYDYSHLSKLFSSVESVTIERFATLQRLERAKELLTYQEHSVAEIAEALDYSSPAHLSAHFKRETGMTPSQFKKLKFPDRRSLDAL